MDIRIKKYIQYKIKTLNERKRELYKLKQERETLRQEIIDESPAPQDGQPKGKGGSSSPVETKVIKLEKIDKRISVLDEELKKFQEIEDKIHLMRSRAILNLQARNCRRRKSRVCCYGSWHGNRTLLQSKSKTT